MASSAKDGPVPSELEIGAAQPNNESGPPTEDFETTETLLAPLRDDAVNDDANSLYASSVAGTETTSLKSAVSKYKQENGRSYHSYGSTEHWGPNDAQAQDQMDLSHQLWLLALKGKFYLAPVERPEDVLDVGTGTGVWAIDVAEQHPETKVVGIDLSAVQPTWVPPNAYFEIDDYNVDWLDEEKYDLIHMREALGTCPDWVELYRKAFA